MNFETAVLKTFFFAATLACLVAFGSMVATPTSAIGPTTIASTVR